MLTPYENTAWTKAVLVSKEIVTEKTDVIIRFEYRMSGRHTYTPGQYCNIRTLSPHGTKPRRSYSIVYVKTVENQTYIEFCIHIIPGGELSQLLQASSIGDEIEIQGPLGNHFYWEPTKHDPQSPLILIAGGNGIAPLMSILRARQTIQKENRPKTILLYSAKHASDIAYRHELEAMGSDDTRFMFKTVLTSDPSTSTTSYTHRIDTEILHAECGRFLDRKPAIYICGSSDFVNTISEYFHVLNVKKTHIHTESFI